MSSHRSFDVLESQVKHDESMGKTAILSNLSILNASSRKGEEQKV
jgi:hypothetical protein